MPLECLFIKNSVIAPQHDESTIPTVMSKSIVPDKSYESGRDDLDYKNRRNAQFVKEVSKDALAFQKCFSNTFFFPRFRCYSTTLALKSRLSNTHSLKLIEESEQLHQTLFTGKHSDRRSDKLRSLKAQHENCSEFATAMDMVVTVTKMNTRLPLEKQQSLFSAQKSIWEICHRKKQELDKESPEQRVAP